MEGFQLDAEAVGVAVPDTPSSRPSARMCYDFCYG